MLISQRGLGFDARNAQDFKGNAGANLACSPEQPVAMLGSLARVDRKKSQHIVLRRGTLANQGPRGCAQAKFYGATVGFKPRCRSRLRPAKGTAGFQSGKDRLSQGDVAGQSRMDQVVE